MAGSEQSGLHGARADLFVGATWVLTPTPATTPERYATLVAMVRDLGATALALTAADHDRLVAMVSHVPHLVAGRDDERGGAARRERRRPAAPRRGRASAT